MEFWLFVAVCYIIYIHVQKSKLKKNSSDQLAEHEKKVQELQTYITELQGQNEQKVQELQDEIGKRDQLITAHQDRIRSLEPFQGCADAAAEASRILQSANESSADLNRRAKEHYANLINQGTARLDEAKRQAKEHYDNLIRQGIAERDEANRHARERRARVEQLMNESNEQASMIIAAAKENAERIAGDAYRALKEADSLKATSEAMANIIKGYGDRYLKPTFGLLDELAELYSFDDAGKQLKLARERTVMLSEHMKAATCEYVETYRKTTAIHFVVDAFNGKVDTILTRAKKDNFGTLEQQIKDSFAVVNHHGSAFRNARITDEYLEARMQELRWAVAVHAVREREKEEQREIRERIREEERARKEIEKALKDAAKEEEAIEKAMARMRQQIDKATDEQKIKYESQLAELQDRLAEAEAKSQRAQSMAQQTRAGHVYIISNEGSFGENVFKIGMTRRLEPLDRVRELGDASVPFAFDVHAMIWSEDAPTLERELHMEFVKTQVNKVNPRKEFFRIGIQNLREAVEKRGIEASWTIAAAAAEYRESLAIEQRMNASPELEREWVRKQASYEIQQENQLEEVIAESEEPKELAISSD